MDAPDNPEAVDLRPVPTGEAEKPPGAGPLCGYCGAASLHESRRGGFRESVLRFFGAKLYRCDVCHRRFAFSVLGRPERHRASRHLEAGNGAVTAVAAVPRERTADAGRGRAVGILTTLIAALLSYALASWLIQRAEERRLDEASQTPRVR